MATNLDRLLDAVDEALTDLSVETPEMARLVLLMDELRPGFLGKEGCSCGEIESCDECPPRDAQLAYMRKVASRDAPPDRITGEG